MEKNQNLDEMQETTILNPNENDEGNAKKPAKKTIIVSTIAAVVVLAGVGGGYAYASNTTYDSYESQLESAKEADSKLVKTLAEARTLVKATKEADVLDKTVLDSLNVSVKTGEAQKGSPKAEDVNKWALWDVSKAKTTVADDITAATKAISSIDAAMSKVESSKTAKQVKDAKDTLNKTISDAETLYKDSEGKVADDKTRESLKTAIDTAKKTVDDKKADVKTLNAQKDAVSKAVTGVNDSKTAKEQADAEAKAEEAARQAAQQQSQAQTQTYSNTNYSRANSGTSTYNAPTQQAQTQQSAPQQSQNQQNNNSNNSGYIKLCSSGDTSGKEFDVVPCN